jgi:DNA repair exonuclease SbcCD ATPase subunit
VDSGSIGVATSDLHAHALSGFSRHIGPDGLTPQGKSLLLTARWLVGLTLQCSSDPWFLNDGDYTNTPGHLDSPTLFLLSELEDIWNSLPKKILNLGNHDIESKVGLHNLYLHSKISGYQLPKPNQILHTNGIYVVPFTHSQDLQLELIRSIPGGSVVAVHTPIVGAYLNPTAEETNGIPLAEFQRFSLTLAGHYHTPQCLNTYDGTRKIITKGYSYFQPFLPGQGAVLILGTPSPHSFADTGNSYGAWVVDLATPYGGRIIPTATFHPNPYAPRYISIEINNKEDLDKVDLRDPGTEERPFYLSITAPQSLHREILGAGIPGVTSLRLRRPTTEAPRRDQVFVPPLPSEGSRAQVLLSTTLSYLDSLGSSYDRSAVARELSFELENLPPVRPTEKIEFLRLIAKNFLSYEELIFNFEAGLWLITGINKDTETGENNGSGKSSLIEAIIWCLYGDLLRDAPSKDSIVHKEKDSCSVEVLLEIGTNKYKIYRSRLRSNSKTIVSTHILNSEEWVCISPGGVSESNRQIETILGISWSDFLLTNLFASYTNSNFAILKDTDKKQFLSRVFDLEAYDKLCSLYKERLSEHNRLIAIADAEHSSQESRRVETLTLYEKRKLLVEKEIAEREEELRLAERSKEGLLEAQAIFLATLQDKRTQLSAAEITLNRNLQIIEELSRLERDIQQNSVFLGSIARDKSNPPSDCSTCGQPLPESAKQRFLDSLNTREAALRDTLTSLQQKKSEIGQPCILSEVEHQITNLKNNITSLEQALQTVSNSISSNSEKIRLLTNLPSPHSSLVDLETILSQTSSKIEELKSRLEDLQKKKDLSSLLVSALGPQGVISYVLDSSVSQLNSYLEYVSTYLYGGDYSVWLSSTKELRDGRDANVITFQYSTPGGSFGLSSGGEKRKAEIALFMAINYLLTSQGRGTTNLIMLDEALDSLDAKAAASAVEALRRFVDEEGKTCLLISHSEGVKALIDRQIIVERQHEVSRISQWIDTRT